MSALHPTDERARWARRVASLIRGGVALVAALETSRDETDSFELAGPLGYLAERVRDGMPLGAAVGDMQEVFTPSEAEAVGRATTSEELAAALEALGPWEPPVSG